MKRIRTLDVPKFRRPVKTRARLGESVYLNPGGFVYAKLILMWISCVLLDFVIGFRIELLWPLWLMIRHLYDAYRVQNFVSSFHYSAFSIFFICVTVTSDLICYLFVPVQVLVFIASTYVWIQFVYQSTDRGFCTPTFLLWGLFIGFEYVIRTRFDQSTLYLTRGSWVTAGLFSTDGTENILVGDPEETLFQFEVYKAIASNCLGFPLVMLGFRVKSYFASWRLKRRKIDVTKQNEFYYRLLADAQPAQYDPRIVTAKQLALDSADFEIDDENVSECGSVITSQPTVCASTALNGTSNGIFTASTPPVSAATTFNRKSRNTAPKSTVAAGSKSQNGYCTTKRNGRAGTASKRDQNEELDDEVETSKRRSFSLVRLLAYFFWLTHFICRSAYDFIVSPVWRVFASNISSALKPGKQNSDDLISNSGDGSLLADEETDREDFGLLKSNESTTKRRSKRARGRTPAVAGEIVTSRALSQQQLKPQATIAPSFVPKPLVSGQQVETCSVHNSPVQSAVQNGNLNGQLHETDKQDLVHQNGRVKEKSKEKCKCSVKVDELESKLRVERGNSRQQVISMEREKEILEQALDNLRGEMNQIRTSETNARAELSLAQNQERSQRSELNQLRTKLNDAEQKAIQATRQLERLKKESAQQQTKKENVRVKRDETRSGTPDQTSKELSDMRLKVQNLEKELQAAQTELKNRQQAYVKLEQRVKTAESASKSPNKEEDDDIKGYQQQIADLQQQNARLEKTLLSENKLKIDLFRALSESKSQLETLTSQMRQTESGKLYNGFDPLPSSDFNNAPLPSSLVASLVNGFGSGCSSPADRISPSSSSSHSILASNTGVSKSSTSIADELEQILQSNQFSYFGSDGFASTATPSTNAAAQALAQQLKMSASPNSNSLFTNNQLKPSQQQQQERSSSPSTNELFSILNAKSISSSFGSYGLSNGATTVSSKMNGDTISSAFH